MKLIPEIQKAYRIASVQVLSVATALWAVWLATPPDAQQAIIAALGLDPAKWGPLLAFIGALIARLVHQPGLRRDAAPQQVNPGV